MVGIAQLVERWIVAPEVAGSNPSTYPCQLLQKIHPPMTYLLLHDLLDSNKSYSTTHLSNAPTLENASTNVSSLLQFTIPDGKLFYPEPFIASPSYLHSDLTYLHIFQYWYWL